MHALIAFFAFVFSPSEDWTLKQTFELFFNPTQLEATVQQAESVANKYPTIFETATGPLSADSVNSVLWSDILTQHGLPGQAHGLRLAAARDSKTPLDLRDQLQLKAGETALALGRLDEANEFFKRIVAQPASPYALDANIDLLISALSANDLVRAKILSAEIQEVVGTGVPVVRARYPLGLTAFALEDYAAAKTQFQAMGEDPRGLYFLGLTMRKLDQPHLALQAWQQLQTIGKEQTWTKLARAQIAETYFSLGDDKLCRAACEKGLADASADTAGPVHEMLGFRMASLDMRAGQYEEALSRLQSLESGSLAKRSEDLIAEALIKTGRSEELLALQRRREPSDNKAERTYQTAWASVFHGKMEPAISIAERGFENFYDPEYTPRLLLLQGLAYEHLGKQAEAMAVYQTAMDRFPNSHAAAQSTHWMTLAYMRLGRTREAVTHGAYAWNQLSDELKRDHPDTAYWLGEAHLRLDRMADADNYLRKFLEMAKPDHPLLMNAQFQRSVALARLKRPVEALAMLDQFAKTAADRKQPQWVAYAQLQRGNIYFNDKQYARAVSAYRNSAGSSKGMYYSGLALHHMEYYTDATLAWAQLVKDRPMEPITETAFFKIARTEFELGHTTTAVNSFVQFAMTYPKSASTKGARLQAGHAFFNAGQLNEAAPYYADYLKRYPTTEDMATVTPYLAACYVRQGKTPAELDLLLAGLPPADPSSNLRWDRGAEKFNSKHTDESSRLFGELAFDTPANENAAAARFYRAESMFAEKNWRDAELALAAFIAANPDSANENVPAAMFHKGVAQFNQDHLMNAAKSFQSLADSFPSHPLAADALQNMLVCYNNLGNWDKRDELRRQYNVPEQTPSAPATAAPSAGHNVAEVSPDETPLMPAAVRDISLAQSHTRTVE